MNNPKFDLEAKQTVFLGETEMEPICVITVTGMSLVYSSKLLEAVADKACRHAANLAVTVMQAQEKEPV